VKKGPGVSGVGDIKNGFIAIVVFNPLEFSCDFFQGLIPGYTGELSFSPVANPFQRVFKTIRGIHPLTVSTSTCTCPELGSLTVIGFNSGNHSVFDMYPEHTSTSTVMRTAGYHFFFHGVSP
jgi:hypothetical protein